MSKWHFRAMAAFLSTTRPHAAISARKRLRSVQRPEEHMTFACEDFKDEGSNQRLDKNGGEHVRRYAGADVMCSHGQTGFVPHTMRCVRADAGDTTGHTAPQRNRQIPSRHKWQCTAPLPTGPKRCIGGRGQAVRLQVHGRLRIDQYRGRRRCGGQHLIRWLVGCAGAPLGGADALHLSSTQ